MDVFIVRTHQPGLADRVEIAGPIPDDMTDDGYAGLSGERPVVEVLSRPMRDRRAVARYAGLTGSPDESGAKRREQGLARAGNARVRRGMIQLAWRFLRFQKESALARWYQARTADSRIGTRKTMIVALARKLVIALWRFVTAGETLEGVILRPAG